MRKIYFIFQLVVCTCIANAKSTDKTVVTEQSKWNNIEDADRSLSNPYLYIDQDKLFFYSDKTLDNVRIEIRNTQNLIVLSDSIHIIAGSPYLIPIDLLAPDKYTIFISHENNYIIALFYN